MSFPRPAIALILKGFPRISETFISNEIELLERSGFTFQLISMRDPRESFTHASVKRIQAKPYYLPSTLKGNWARLLKANGRAFILQPRRYCRAVVSACVKWRQSRSWATVKHLLQAGYLVRHFLPASGATRLHAHFAHSPTSVAYFAHVISGLPFGFTGHAKDIYTQRLQALEDKLHRADLVITCTRHNRRYLEQLGGRKVHHVYHGIDVRLFAYRGVVHPRGNRFTLLSVSRQVEKKGLDVVLTAVASLRRQGLDVVLRHAGSGPLAEELLVQARELGLGDVIVWLGTMTHEQVIDEYAAADAFVLGCRVAENGDRDGLPNVLPEAMAVGVPVVATNVSAIPELIEHGGNGLLVQPEDPEALARALKRVLTDYALRERIIPAARQRVVDMFDNRKCIQALAKVFQDA